MDIDYSVKPSLGQKLKPVLRNWRLMAFLGFFVLIFGSLGYTIFGEMLTGGIHKRGELNVVNLKALGQFPFDEQSGTLSDVPKDFRGLDGKKVALQGYMFTTKSAAPEVSDCQLVWNVQKCCFGGPPLVQERVFLYAPGDRKMSRYDQNTLVNITGTLRVKVNKNKEGIVTSLYEMVPDSVNPA